MTAEEFGIETVDGGGGDFATDNRAVKTFALNDDDGAGLADVGFRAKAHDAFAEVSGLIGLGENLLEGDALIDSFLRDRKEGEEKKNGGAGRHGKSIEGWEEKRKIKHRKNQERVFTTEGAAKKRPTQTCRLNGGAAEGAGMAGREVRTRVSKRSRSANDRI